MTRAREPTDAEYLANPHWVGRQEELREHKRRGDACNTLYGEHGNANARGECPYCGRKVTAAQPKPDSLPVSNLTMAYERTYDPDWGSRKRDIDV